MKNRLLNMILLCICVVLAVICCVLTITRHNENPYFQSEDVELVYHDGMTEEELLKGLTAHDKEDGELTDRILISSKRTSEEGLTVTYEVWDSNHDKAVFTRTYETSSSEQGDLEENHTLSAGDDAQDESESGISEETPSQEDAAQGENEEPETEESPSQSESESEVPQGSEEVPVAANPEAPVLVLNGNSVEIAAGSSFHYWNYIETLEDDKDDFAYLSNQIVIDGQYDINVPGTYELVFWLMDSDGNSSVRQTFVLTVQ